MRTSLAGLLLALATAGGAASATAAPAEILDRVVASIGSVALTESDVIREYQFEQFLEGRSVTAAPDATTFSRVRDRLIDQTLLLQEAEVPAVDGNELSARAVRTLAEVRKIYASEDAFQAALRALGMDEHQVLDRLTQHELMMRIIDQRLRPAVSVERAEIEDYYRETFLPEFTRRSTQPLPSLAEVEGDIRQILVEKKMDRYLEDWLKDLRVGHDVQIHSGTHEVSGKTP